MCLAKAPREGHPYRAQLQPKTGRSLMEAYLKATSIRLHLEAGMGLRRALLTIVEDSR